MPTGILDLMGYMQGQADAGRQQGKQSLLARLASQAYAAPQAQRSQIVQQAIGVDPQSGFALEKSLQGGDDERMQRVGQMAGMLVNLPPEARAQAYPGIVQQLHSIGLGDGLPDQWDDSLLPYAQQLAGIGGGSNGVQSTYIDAQGNRVAIMRDGSTQVLGQNAPQNQIIDTGNGFYGVNKGNLQAAPVMVGGSQGGAVPYTIDPSLPLEVQAAIRQNESAFAAIPDGGSVQIGEQLRKAPKPIPAITPYQQAQMDMQRQRLEAAQQAAHRAAEAAQAAQAVKQQAMDAKAQKARVAAQDSVDTYRDAIQTIDALRSHPGYAQIGTPMGDLSTNIPVIRTEAKGANATLETLKSQIMINTLSKLKALSATGAAGFGALNQSEGDALRRAIANLDTAQSHADLDRAVLRVREVMQRSAERIAEAAGGLGGEARGGDVDDLLNKYGVK